MKVAIITLWVLMDTGSLMSYKEKTIDSCVEYGKSLVENKEVSGAVAYGCSIKEIETMEHE